MKNALTCRLAKAVVWAHAAVVASVAVANPVVIGQSAGLTGGQAAFSKDAQVGIQVYFDAVNKAGGVSGRPLQLVSIDDQGKRDITLANSRALVNEKNAVALIAYTSGAGVESALQYIGEAKVPMLSPLTGNMAIRAKFNRYLFHTRAGYDAEMDLVIKHLRSHGMSRYALVYLEDAKANGTMMREALTKQKLQPVASVELNRNSTDFSVQTASLLKASPEAVIFITNGPPLAKIAEAMRKDGYKGQIISSSFAGTRFVDEMKEGAAGIVVTQVLPSLSRESNKVVRDFKTHLKTHAPDAKPNATNFESYIAARVLVEALRRTKGNISRESVLRALESIDRYDLGGYEVRYNEREHEGSRFVDTAVVAKNGSLRY